MTTISHSDADTIFPTQAKGYPDLSTRSFLRLLSTSHAPTSQLTPIYALTDFDPDGIAIMSTYKHGSLRLSHENAHLIVPSIHWLGIQSSDVLDESDGQEGNGLLRLTRRDRKKAAKMLEWDVLREEGLEGGWRREVQVMLMLGFKAEMEILGAKDGGVEGWVEGKLLERSRGF
jgi:meiotic recombination protein SPO11